MARETRHYAVTIPAGTPIASPVAVTLDMPARIVRRIRWRVPPGPSGLMGWQLGSGGVQVIPWNTGAWIVADDETDVLAPEGQISSGAWQLIGYNSGAYDHTVYLTFDMDPPQVVAPTSLVLYDYGALSAGGGGGTQPPPDTGPPAATYADGYALGRGNALAAMAYAFGDAATLELAPVPAAMTDAGTGYDDAKAAALVALGDLSAADVIEGVPASDGFGIARVRAVAAVSDALGAPITGTVPAAPAFGDVARAEYDRGRLAALGALAAIQPG